VLLQEKLGAVYYSTERTEVFPALKSGAKLVGIRPARRLVPLLQYKWCGVLRN